jgi:hypothetical protein
MPDFKKALQTGLTANAKAIAERIEIRSVVAEVSLQLGEATGGAIHIGLGESTRQKVRYITNALAILATGERKEVTTEEYTSIFAERTIDPKLRTELAEVEIQPEGYPVYVNAPNVRNSAYDRASLETALATLLEHPDTGAKLQRLIDVKPTSG